MTAGIEIKDRPQNHTVKPKGMLVDGKWVEGLKAAMSLNAGAVILAHNHPSGDPTPSEADIRVTRDLIRAGHLLKIEVLDHLILGRRTVDRTRDYSSLRELGYWGGL